MARNLELHNVKLSGFGIVQYQYNGMNNNKSNSFNLRLGRVSLDNFGGQENCETFSLGQEEQAIQNQYPDKDFERYGKTYQTFNTELYQGKANQITINLPVTKDLHLNGRAQLNLRIKSSTNKGLLSAQLLEFGQKKYLQPYPAILSARTIDNGRYHMLENLCELPFRPDTSSSTS